MRRIASLITLLCLIFAAPAAAQVYDDNPATASRGPGDTWVFARAGDGQIVERHLSGGKWTAWSSLGGALTSGPAATDLGNTIYVFARGTDGAIYQNANSGSGWSGWRSLGGGATTSAPAAEQRRGRQYIDLAARGGSNQLWVRTFTAGTGWGAWNSPGRHARLRHRRSTPPRRATSTSGRAAPTPRRRCSRGRPATAGGPGATGAAGSSAHPPRSRAPPASRTSTSAGPTTRSTAAVSRRPATAGTRGTCSTRGRSAPRRPPPETVRITSGSSPAAAPRSSTRTGGPAAAGRRGRTSARPPSPPRPPPHADPRPPRHRRRPAPWTSRQRPAARSRGDRLRVRISVKQVKGRVIRVTFFTKGKGRTVRTDKRAPFDVRLKLEPARRVQGPRLRAALLQAQRAHAPQDRVGPLHGVPVRRLLLCVLATLLLASPARADVFDDNPATASRGPGDGWIFIRGKDGDVLERHRSGTGWTDWASLGGQATSGPAAAPYGDQLFLFVRGPDGGLWSRTYANGAWAQWTALGRLSVIRARRRAAPWHRQPRRRRPRRRQRDRLAHYTAGGGWSGWASLGGVFTSGPAIGSYQDGAFNFWGRGTDGALKVLGYENGAWNQWTDFGGFFYGAPTAVSRSPGFENIYVLDASHGVSARAWVSGQPWTGWLLTDPAADRLRAGSGRRRARSRMARGARRQRPALQGMDRGRGWGAWTDLGPIAVGRRRHRPRRPRRPVGDVVSLQAGTGCTPSGTRLRVRISVKQVKGKMIRVTFFTKGKGRTIRTDKRAPFDVRLMIKRPAGSKGRVYARLYYKRGGHIHRKTVSGRYAVCP